MCGSSSLIVLAFLADRRSSTSLRYAYGLWPLFFADWISLTAAAHWPLRNDRANNHFFRLCKVSHNRMNWIFSDSLLGVKPSANLYSLIESAKASWLEPYQYLRQEFTEVTQANAAGSKTVK